MSECGSESHGFVALNFMWNLFFFIPQLEIIRAIVTHEAGPRIRC